MFYVTFNLAQTHAKVYRDAASAVNNYSPLKHTLHKVPDELVDPSATGQLMDELRRQVAKKKFLK